MKSKKIKIGINASFLRRLDTGIGQVTLGFLKNLAKLKDKNHNFQVILYLEEKTKRNIKLPKDFQKKVFLPPIWKRDDLIRKVWWEKFMLPRIVKKDSCDIFISLYQNPTIIKTAKHIMLVHDIIPKIFPEYLGNSRKKIYWKLTQEAAKSVDRIVTISKNTEKDIIKHLNIEGKKITSSYIDVDEIYKKEVSQEESGQVLRKYKLKPGYIFAGGGYEKRKNIENVIRAYKIISKQNSNSHFISEMPRLVIYGKKLPKKLPLAFNVDKLLKELNLTKQVSLLDFVPQKNMPALFFNAKCFVYPSYYEGFGMPVLEAMNSGTPVITSKGSSLPEVGGDSVLYCHADDPHDLGMVLKNLLTKEDLRNELTQRGLERAKNFSWNKFTKKVLSIAESLS